MPAPIDYGVQIADPTQSFLSAFQTGAGIQETRLKQEQQQQQMANQKLIQDGLTKLRQPGATVEDVSNLAMILPKDQSESVLKAWALKTDAQKQNALSRTGKVVSALFAGENDIAQQLINDEAVAMRNSGNEEGAKFLETWRGITEINPTATERFFTAQLLQLPGGDKIVENVIKLGAEKRAEAEAPSKLTEQKAKAALAVQNAENAVATAPDDVALAKARREFEQAKAAKEAVDAKYAERIAVDAIIKRAADLNLTKSQTNKVLVETRNLTETGKMLKLDYEAAVKGVPLPSKNTGANVGNATEDERKAAGWLSQADNAYKNMLSAMYTKEGKRTGAEEPGVGEAIFGNIARGADRQNFVQAASSLSEALLRAATGAGVNADEAKQKLEELTPLLTDGAAVVGQKLAAIPVYLDSLKARAGRAAPTDYRIPTKESVTAAKEITITVGGKTFSFPTQDAADAFKKAAGIN
jgi:hypothetical protein